MAAVQSVVRALSILRAFSPDAPVLGVAELSRMLNMERSAVQRAVASLVEGGLLNQEPVSGKYSLGLGLLELAGTMLQGRYHHGAVRPYLRELADLSGESVYLAVLYNSDSAIQIDDVASPHLVQYPGWIGRQLPLYCTASGKILMANMAPEHLEKILKTTEFKSFTSMTITNPDELRQDLVIAKEQGFAISEGEYTNGLISIASSVPGVEGGVSAAVTIIGPKYRFTKDKALECADALRAIAGKVPARPFLFKFD